MAQMQSTLLREKGAHTLKRPFPPEKKTSARSLGSATYAASQVTTSDGTTDSGLAKS